MDLPFSESAERNKTPIFEQLNILEPNAARFLQIGSYTGQHVVHFCKLRKDWQWQPSDQPEYLETLQLVLEQNTLDNISKPVALNVSSPSELSGPFDCIYTANTLHIMSWRNVVDFCRLCAKLTQAGSRLYIYGPFFMTDVETAESNIQFNESLKSRDPEMGIRDFEAVKSELKDFEFGEVIFLPANNVLTTWRRK